MRNLTFLDFYINYLIKKTENNSRLGLWNGKMGVAITLLHWAQITRKAEFEGIAIELIDVVYENLSYQQSFSFANGLCGIGCGVEYIVENQFMGGDSDEILLDIDRVILNIINARSIKGMGLKDGICGIGFYLYCRLKRKMQNESKLQTLHNKEYLIYLIDWIEDELCELSCFSDISDIYLLLYRLHKLNVFNSKIDKLIAISLEKLEFIDKKRMQDNYFCLGIPSLQLLAPWIKQKK